MLMRHVFVSKHALFVARDKKAWRLGLSSADHTYQIHYNAGVLFARIPSVMSQSVSIDP